MQRQYYSILSSYSPHTHTSLYQYSFGNGMDSKEHTRYCILSCYSPMSLYTDYYSRNIGRLRDSTTLLGLNCYSPWAFILKLLWTWTRWQYIAIVYVVVKASVGLYTEILVEIGFGLKKQNKIHYKFSKKKKKIRRNSNMGP